MARYSKDGLPTSVSWINELNKDEATLQCLELGLTPDDRLAAMREQLHKFVKSQGQGPPPDQTTNLAADQTINVTTNLMANQASASNPLKEPTPELDPQVAHLLKSMQQMTMQAITQSVTAVTQQLQALGNNPTQDTTLPPFVRDMLKELPKTSGHNTDQTINFFAKITKIIDLKIASEKAIILNSSAYTQDSLREFWMENVAADSTWAALLGHFRDKFFTPESLRAAQDKFLYRSQSDTEDLADFVKNIQVMFRILAPATSEQDIFQTVFRNINPQTRTTFAGLPPIETLADLIKIAPFSASVSIPRSTPLYHQSREARIPNFPFRPSPNHQQFRYSAPNSNFHRTSHNNYYKPRNGHGPETSPRANNYNQYQHRNDSSFRPRHFSNQTRQFSPQPPYNNSARPPPFNNNRFSRNNEHPGNSNSRRD